MWYTYINEKFMISFGTQVIIKEGFYKGCIGDVVNAKIIQDMSTNTAQVLVYTVEGCGISRTTGRAICFSAYESEENLIPKEI